LEWKKSNLKGDLWVSEWEKEQSSLLKIISPNDAEMIRLLKLFLAIVKSFTFMVTVVLDSQVFFISFRLLTQCCRGILETFRGCSRSWLTIECKMTWKTKFYFILKSYYSSSRHCKIILKWKVVIQPQFGTALYKKLVQNMKP